MSKVLITLGATGGHIFPALAISEAINKVDDKIEVAFVNAYKTNIKMLHLCRNMSNVTRYPKTDTV